MPVLLGRLLVRRPAVTACRHLDRDFLLVGLRGFGAGDLRVLVGIGSSSWGTHRPQENLHVPGTTRQNRQVSWAGGPF